MIFNNIYCRIDWIKISDGRVDGQGRKLINGEKYLGIYNGLKILNKNDRVKFI